MRLRQAALQAFQTWHVLLLGCFLHLAWGPVAVHAGEPLHVGVAEVEITPPKGFPMAGYYHERLATGTKDPLKARAIVFRQGKERAALVVCDLCGIAVDLTTEVRRQASARTDIPQRHIVLSATHSHTSPDYTRDLYGYLGSAAKERQADAYAAKLIGGVVDAIVKAHEKAEPSVLHAGTVRQETPVSFNRRFLLRDGSVRTWMALDHPEVLRAAGPIDPDLGLFAVRAIKGQSHKAVFSNFALHLDTVGGLEWSADYPFFIERAVRESLGKSVISIFGNGCCGDINHVDPARRERNKTAFIGGSLGETVCKGLAQLPPVKQPVLRVQSTVVPLLLQPVTKDEVTRATQFLSAARDGAKVDFLDQVKAYKHIILDNLHHRHAHTETAKRINWGLSRTWAGVGDRLPVEVSLITLGDELAIVCLPGEVFVDLGLAIKRSSPFRTTILVELSNCVETAYIPTRVACAAGSYEVTNSLVQHGSGELLAEAAVRLLRIAASAARSAGPERKSP
jgi:hypothetical protein